MKNLVCLILVFYVMVGCSEDDNQPAKITDGVYVGTFQRKLSRADNQTANITIIFSSNQWTGTSDMVKYPALCHGTYSIKGDTIVFENECAWTAEFDWSLILSGKYVIKNSGGTTIEFSRDYRSSTGDIYTDEYKIKK